jgi:hypothetical protein
MAKAARPRLYEVELIAMSSQLWEWRVCEGAAVIVSGDATSRESAQIEADSALFLLLRSNI